MIFEKQSSNEAFSRTILNQIIVFALYEKKRFTIQSSSSSSENQIIPKHHAEIFQQSSSSSGPTVLKLLYETFLQRPIAFKEELRLLSDYADYTVWYEAQRKQYLSTNLIIIETKKRDRTDTCLGQLAAYMGIIHAGKKENKKKELDNLRCDFEWLVVSLLSHR